MARARHRPLPRRPVGKRVLAALRAKAAAVRWEAEPGEVLFLLCSRGGFTRGCRDAGGGAAGDDLLLLDLPRLAALCAADRV